MGLRVPWGEWCGFGSLGVSGVVPWPLLEGEWYGLRVPLGWWCGLPGPPGVVVPVLGSPWGEVVRSSGPPGVSGAVLGSLRGVWSHRPTFWEQEARSSTDPPPAAATLAAQVY